MSEIIRIGARITGRVEITRSFSYKLNVGSYESRDFFCSQKAECAAEEAAEIGDLLYEFCKSQVLSSVKDYKKAVANRGKGNSAEFEKWKQEERKTA